MEMESVIDHVLISEEQLSKKVKELASKINRDYAGEELLLIGVLKGSVMFAVDLMREISIPVELDFMAVSSYGSGVKTSGVVKILKDLDNSVEGKNILIVEDIVDSGLTLSYLKEMLLSRNPASVRICTILNKPSRRNSAVEVDYSGYDIPDEFVVGYGLDYNQKYRNLPYVGVLKREVYEK